MGDDARDVKVKLSVDDTTRAGFQDAEKSVSGFLDRMAAKAKSVQRESRESGEGALDRLLSGGAGGLTKFGLGALGMGMQGLAVEMVGQSLKGATDKALEAVNKVRDGGGAGDLFESLMGSVPIVGDFWEAGRGIHEMITGDEYNQKREEKVSELDDQIQQGRNGLFEAMAKARHQMQEQVMGSQVAAHIAQEWRVPEDQARDTISESVRKAKQDASDAIKANNEAIDNANKKLRADLAARIQVLSTQSSQVAPPSGGFDSFGALGEGADYKDSGEMSEELRGVMKDRDDLEKKIADQKAEFAQGTNDKLANQIAEGQSRLDELNARFEHDRVETLRANQNEILDMTAKFQSDKLRLEGRGLDAELTLINAGADKQREAIAHSLSEDLKAHAGNPAYSILRTMQAGAEMAGVTADTNLQTIMAKRSNEVQARGARDEMTDMIGAIINSATGLPGAGDTAESRELKYKLNQQSTIRSFREQIDDLAHGPQGAAAAASLAQMTSLVDQYQKDALSPEMIKRAGMGEEGPLRFAGYEEHGEGYTGLAENQAASDLDRQVRDRDRTFGDMRDLLSKAVDLLNKIQQQGQPGAVGSGGPPLFSSGGY